MFKSFSSALSFLTIIRLPSTGAVITSADLAAGFACFPLTGLILGLIYCSPAYLFAGRVPAPLLSVLICTLMVALTRGLHLDGLADLADGVWGGANPERRLEIMKDSHIGSFGVLALILAIFFKATSVYALISVNRLEPLLLAPVLARFAMVAAAHGSLYARQKGLGKPFLENMRTRHLVIAAALAVLITVPMGPSLVLYFIPVLGLVIFFRSFTRKMLGGITGDVFGAVSETTEILVLFLGAISF